MVSPLAAAWAPTAAGGGSAIRSRCAKVTPRHGPSVAIMSAATRGIQDGLIVDRFLKWIRWCLAAGDPWRCNSLTFVEGILPESGPLNIAEWPAILLPAG